LIFGYCDIGAEGALLVAEILKNNLCSAGRRLISSFNGIGDDGPMELERLLRYWSLIIQCIIFISMTMEFDRIILKEFTKLSKIAGIVERRIIVFGCVHLFIIGGHQRIDFFYVLMS
jgi:hypothetical protein